MAEGFYVFENKDPDALLDYQFDWTDWLGADTISTYTLTSSDPINFPIESDSNTSKAVTVWVSGGVIGTKPTITCRIETASGRIDERTARFPIKQR